MRALIELRSGVAGLAGLLGADERDFRAEMDVRVAAA
jgi:hypothetical protein